VRGRVMPLSGRLRWLVLFVALSALGGVWAVATPLYGVPDEPAHAVYSAAAVRGELFEPGDGNRVEVRVPADFAAAGAVPVCYAFQPEVPAGCAAAYPDVDGEASVVTTAGRYPPAYYLYAGLATFVDSGAQTVYLMRLLTAVLVGALLASATCSVLDRRRAPWTSLGLALAGTPMLFFFAGAVNPQAPEIAAAVLLWTSGAALLVTLRADPGRQLRLRDPLVRRVVVGAAVLSLARPLSLLWLALVVACLLGAFATAPALRAIVTSRAGVVGAVVVGITSLTTLGWVLVRDSLIQQDVPIFADLPFSQAVITAVEKADNEYREMIGVFGWRDNAAPGIAYVVFTLLLGSLLLVGSSGARRRQLAVLAALAGVVLLLPGVLDLSEYESSAFAWQGRYTLPIAVGVPLLLGFFADERGQRRVDLGVTVDHSMRRVALAFGAGLVVVHVAAFVGALNRNVHGVSGWWFVSQPGWVPPLPSWLLVAGCVVVCCSLAAGLVGVVGSQADRPAGGRSVRPPEQTGLGTGAAPVDRVDQSEATRR
ncbi:Protein of unknown function DUF2142, membrane, partial [Klenkia terrae]|jgi:hypothetical protein